MTPVTALFGIGFGLFAFIFAVRVHTDHVSGKCANNKSSASELFSRYFKFSLCGINQFIVRVKTIYARVHARNSAVFALIQSASNPAMALYPRSKSDFAIVSSKALLPNGIPVENAARSTFSTAACTSG